MCIRDRSCRVRWSKTLSDSFSVKNGVRQGAVLSPTLFSLYMNNLLMKLEYSGYGCYVNNFYYGSSAYADDIILLCPSRNGLQEMFNICQEYFLEHQIIISTNEIVEKSKTKCLYFSNNRNNIKPAPIMFGDRPLPWVDSWAHLGNDLDRTDLCLQRKSSLYKDANQKRMKFIGKFYSLRQEFGFCDPDIFFNILNIYATSFYGSNLWLFSGPSCEKLFKSWNIMIRNVWNLPNTTHKYFIEQISES